MDSPEQTAERHRRRRLAALLVCALCGLAVVAWAATQPPETWTRLREVADEAMAWVRGLGAGWFFAAFAVLPAVGFPVSPFAFGAGSLFGPVLGLPLVLILSGLCMAVSMTISYGLARFVVRPWVWRLLAFLGYTIPEVPERRAGLFVFMVRITPGAPYVFQNLLLGVAGVRFTTYLTISWVVSTASIGLMIVFGDAVMKGQWRVALAALAGVVLVALAIKFARKKLGGRSLVAAKAATTDDVSAGEGGGV
jgi:Uncharacterized conserved protein